MTSSTPSPVLQRVNTTGPPWRMRRASRAMTSRLAPTCGARSILLIDEQIALRDAGPALARDLVAAGDVDDVDREVGELAAVLRGEVVAAALDEEELGLVAHELLERVEVRRDVLADRGVRAAAGLDGADLRGGQRFVAVEELGVLAREDVVGHDAERDAVAQLPAQREHERGLAAADRAADPDA